MQISRHFRNLTFFGKMLNVTVNLKSQYFDEITGKMKAKIQLKSPPDRLMKSINSIPVTETPKHIEIRIPLKITSFQYPPS